MGDMGDRTESIDTVASKKIEGIVYNDQCFKYWNDDSVFHKGY